MITLIAIGAFILGGLCVHFANRQMAELEQMTKEQYRECVAEIQRAYPGAAKQMVEELNRFMDDVTMLPAYLSVELEQLVRRVTNNWNNYEHK